MRVTIDPALGVVVTVPPATRRGWAHPEAAIERFLRERESWLRRHVDAMARERADLAARGGLTDGAAIRYRGELHRLRIVNAAPGTRRSSVARVGAEDGDEIVVRVAAPDRRPVGAVLEAWLRERARAAIDAAIAAHASALKVAPAAISVRDQRSRWGSASRQRRLSFSWRLVLAPPEALETVVIHELAHLRVFGHGPAFWALVASRRPDHLVWRRWLRTHSYELHAALDASDAAA
jgi:predicted metal-dependent hydrolase